jgi:hypothetical protein
MSRSAVRARLTSHSSWGLLALALAGSRCSSEEFAPARPFTDQAPVIPLVDASVDASNDAGCSAPQLAMTDQGCRADWTCTTLGGLTLACTKPAADAGSEAGDGAGGADGSEGGSVCGCVEEDKDLLASGPVSGSPCSDGSLAAVARTLCGWAVP